MTRIDFLSTPPLYPFRLQLLPFPRLYRHCRACRTSSEAIVKKSTIYNTTMKPSTSLLKGLRVPIAKAVKPTYTPPALASVSASELPNNAFDANNLYHIKKTAFGHWPVYKKVQNTKVTTEIKRVEGNVSLLAEELTNFLFAGNVPKKAVKVNTITGEVNIKGDLVRKIKTIFDQKLL